MRILLDTNVVIRNVDRHESLGPLAARLVSLADGTEAEFVVHPASLREATQATTIGQLSAFPALDDAEEPSAEFRALIETQRSPGHPDDALLFVLNQGRVDLLVTEDRQIHTKARRAGLEERVLYLGQAVRSLSALFGSKHASMPGARRVLLYDVPVTQPFFDSLKGSYGEDFETWYSNKCVGQGRHGWIVGDPEALEAICITKIEEDDDPWTGWLKICTFKVDESATGQHYGELLIKTAFEEGLRRDACGVFVEVAVDEQENLVGFLSGLGFVDAGEKPGSSDRVFAKTFAAPDSAADLADVVQSQLIHWPWIDPAARLHVVPIKPRWHRVLFPDAPHAQQSLDSDSNPVGLGLRKAYLCHAPTNQISPGDTLAFYESAPVSAITTLATVERVFRSDDPDHIAAHVAKRTVYTIEEIREQAAAGSVLVLVFRQVQHLDEPIPLGRLVRAHVASAGAWQSIAEVRDEAAVALRELLGIA